SVITDHDFKRNGTDGPINLTLHMAIGGVPHCEDVRTAEHLLDHVSDKLKEAKKTRNNSILICPQNRVVDQRPLNDLIIGGDHREYRYTVEFVNALANTVKLKDMYTREHSACMSNYAVSIAEYMRLSEGEIRIIKLGSILHDIGKIGIDKMILLKPGALTGQEYDIIKQHPRIGAEIIRNVQPLKDIVPLVLYHHERFDGKGYLKKLKGEDIPLGARIISLADVFQALTSDRPYRKALPEKEALGIIKESSGTYFDPKVVKAFLEIY
ncbi:MAG: HD-GYP domain-containing protein, partial [Candidatus Omnitrophica bacterium]|nr:HD-GYP domain-containing protein [Candidatus Omnitrophota bacterium]